MIRPSSHGDLRTMSSLQSYCSKHCAAAQSRPIALPRATTSRSNTAPRCRNTTHSSADTAKRRPMTNVAPSTGEATKWPRDNRGLSQSHKGKKCRPAIVSAPKGVLKPLRITAAILAGAFAKQPVFQATLPSACVHANTNISKNGGNVPQGAATAKDHIMARLKLSTRTSKAAPNSVACPNARARYPSKPSKAMLRVYKPATTQGLARSLAARANANNVKLTLA
mmetsp:Transcript_51962/g.167247  ORF Transcript_51962/g.167247 Transcript_51962/m.167247 type:complete len:224 (-) Transcript_51962:83-754(-)